MTLITVNTITTPSSTRLLDAGWKDGEMEAHLRMYAAHHQAFCAHLRPFVQQALMENVQALRRDGHWPNLARRFLGSFAAGKGKPRTVARVAMMLKTAARMDPTDEDVADDTHALADHLLDNWWSILRQLASTADDKKVTFDDLVPDTHTLALMEATDRFLIDTAACRTAMEAYRDEMVRPTGEVHLAPDMVLRCRPVGGWEVRLVPRMSQILMCTERNAD